MPQDTTLRFNHGVGVPSTLVFSRPDGHELSLSSQDRSLIHWNEGDVVKDYGTFTTTEKLLAALAEFTADAVEMLECPECHHEGAYGTVCPCGTTHA